MSRFESARDNLKEAIKGKMLPKNSSMSSTAFLPHGVARELFMVHRQLVQDLYLHASPERTANLLEVCAFWDIVTAQHARSENGDIPENLALANVLAMLIHYGVEARSSEWRVFETHCMAQSTVEPFLRDDQLPLTVDDMGIIFGLGKAEVFFGAQFQFCPVRLKENQLLVLPVESRLPYISKPTELGMGAYGVVYMVKLPARHYRDKHLHDNETLKYLARKDLRIDNRDRYRRDWTNVQWVVNNHSDTKNVMIALASFEQGSVFSVFFEYAPLGDLWKYIQNKERRSEDWTWKQNIIKATYAVASGLNYLHNQLRDQMDHVSCFHTDLKPSNILVVHGLSRPLTLDGKVVGDNGGPQSDVTFKITDFGVSGITRARDDSVTINPFERLVQHPREILSARDQSVTNMVGHGSHCLAPEALPRDSRVKASTDVWAFGCVMCMVIAWLHDGWDGEMGVDKFSVKRQDASNFRADYFFALSDPHLGRRPQPNDLVDTIVMGNRRIEQVMSVNPAVPEWFEGVLGTIQRRPEEAVYGNLWKLLKERILIPDPSKRALIEDVEAALYAIGVGSSDRPGVPIGSSASSGRAHPSLADNILADRDLSLSLGTCKPTGGGSTPSTTLTVKLSGTTGCLASPDGAYVAFTGQNIVYVYALSPDLARLGTSAKISPTFSVQKTDDLGLRWAKSCLSNNHLCVMSTDETQTVFDHYGLGCETGPRTRLSQAWSKYGRCCAFVVSPDGLTVVYGVTQKARTMIYMIERGESLDGQESKRLRFQAGALKTIEELRFSNQGRYLSVVERTESPSLSIRVHTWDFAEREEMGMYQFYPDNTSFRGGSRTVFTSIVHLPEEEPGFVLALQESGLMMFNFRRNILNQIVAPEAESNHRLFLWSLDEHKSIIVVGKSQGGRRIGIFETLGYQDTSSRRMPSATTVAKASDTNCASVYKAKNGALFLVLCRCNGKLEILSLT
ncbi:hypothetical protein LTR97_005583 [Elasticomyces elasticus]|uniref:Protein kinase domain-containing protein n=1 Tax=Elasticomyces elasticus TaxID=574655 RepID=A0AAN7W693_9PEZI|nr:hypothetical protein LTR97_005583 [Elasticomyces elasticus]